MLDDIEYIGDITQVQDILANMLQLIKEPDVIDGENDVCMVCLFIESCVCTVRFCAAKI